MTNDKQKIITMPTLLTGIGILVAILLFSGQLWIKTAQDFNAGQHSLWTAGWGISFICGALLFLFLAFIVAIHRGTVSKLSLALALSALLLTVFEVMAIFLPLVWKIVNHRDITAPLFEPNLSMTMTIFIYILPSVVSLVFGFLVTYWLKLFDNSVEKQANTKNNTR